MPKQDLFFKQPYMNAAGSLGFTPEFRQPLPWHSLGAFVTNPISMRPRLPAVNSVRVSFAGGFLLHTGLPNLGLNGVLKKYAHKWRESKLPIIVHLMADRPDETARMVRMLETVENVMAVELGFAAGLADDILVYVVEMAQGELPLIACLPFEQVDLAASLMNAGASAISLAAPRLSMPTEDGLISGRGYGPAIYPQALEMVKRLTGAGFPVVAGGGVYRWEHAHVMLGLGAMAVQFDSALWGLGDLIKNNLEKNQ